MLYQEPKPLDSNAQIKNLQAVVRQFLIEDELEHSVDENGDFQLYCDIDCTLRRCSMRIIVYENGILSIAYAPTKAEPSSFPRVKVYLTLANASCMDGHFDLDPDSSFIRYSTFLRCISAMPPVQDVRNAFYFALFTMETYGNGLAKMLACIGNPQEEIRLASTQTD